MVRRGPVVGRHRPANALVSAARKASRSSPVSVAGFVRSRARAASVRTSPGWCFARNGASNETVASLPSHGRLAIAAALTCGSGSAVAVRSALDGFGVVGHQRLSSIAAVARATAGCVRLPSSSRSFAGAVGLHFAGGGERFGKVRLLFRVGAVPLIQRRIGPAIDLGQARLHGIVAVARAAASQSAYSFRSGRASRSLSSAWASRPLSPVPCLRPAAAHRARWHRVQAFGVPSFTLRSGRGTRKL